MILTDQSMTLQDFVLKLAVRFGVAVYANSSTDNKPKAPTDQATLYRLVAAINDGARAFYRAYPKWSWRTATMRILIESDGSGQTHIGLDAAKVWLGYGISGGPVNAIRCVVADGQPAELDQSTEEEISGLHLSSTAASMPTRAAICYTDENNAVGMRSRAYVWLWPTPNQDMTLVGTFRRMPYPLANMGERFPFPSVHDDTLLAFAAYALAETGAIPSGPSLDALKIERDNALRASIDEDVLMGQQESGPLTGGRNNARLSPGVDWTGQITVTGTDIPALP